MKNSIKISLITVAFLSSLHAQESIILEPLTVDSTAIKTDELKSTDAVEIYTAKDIEDAHVQNIYEFLNEHSSVVTMPSYGNPFTQSIDIHGYGLANGFENVVITLDGRKLNNIDSVPQLLATISPDSIERIEIIKSSGIVTAGDGANGGVINIITKKNNNTKEVSFYGGSYGMADGAFYLANHTDKLSISANAEAQKSNGIRTIDTNANKDANKLATGSFNLTYTPIEQLELRLGATSARTDVTYGGSMTKAQYESNPTQLAGYSSEQLLDTDAINAGLTYFVDEKLSLHVDTSHEEKKSDYVPSYSGPSYYDYNYAKISLDYVAENITLSGGYDGFYGARKQSSNTFHKQNNAGFFMSQFHFGVDTIKAGYRFETVHYDFANQGLNSTHTLHGAELGYSHRINKESSLFANYSHSYQAPDIDKFFGFNSITYQTFYSGNINPMEANNYTIGYNNIQKNNKFKASLYYIDLKNEIYYDPSYMANPNSLNTNISKSHKYGVDLSDKIIVNQQFNAVLNYNYVQAIIDQDSFNASYSGKELPGVSNHSVKATLNYLPNPFATLALIETYRSEAYAADDFANNFSQKQAPYTTTDIAATYAKKNWEIFAKINNLFNQKNGLWVKDNAIYPVNFTTTAIAGVKLKF
jgi:iron complex outermembrane receptor protein